MNDPHDQSFTLLQRGLVYESSIREGSFIRARRKKERKEWKINVFAMLLVLLVIAAVITHILPAGKYEQIEKMGIQQ